jgi:hypothetical protein
MSKQPKRQYETSILDEKQPQRTLLTLVATNVSQVTHESRNKCVKRADVQGYSITTAASD